MNPTSPNGKQIGGPMVIQCEPNDKVSNIIQRYRNLAIDYDNSKIFIFNGRELNDNLTVAETGIYNNSKIFVHVKFPN